MTLTLIKVARGGYAAYRLPDARGSVYLTRRMYGGEAPPAFIEIAGDTIGEFQPAPRVKKAATADTAAA